jgi:hypothetical protein
MPAIGAIEMSNLAPTADGSRALPAPETFVGNDDAAATTSILGQQASIAQAHPLLVHGAAPPAALDQGTDLAAATAPAALVAQGIVMPSAGQLLAIGHGLADGPHAATQAIGDVARVLLDALAGGEASGPIDALLDALPGTTGAGNAAATGLDHLGAQFAAVLDTGHDAGFGPGPGAFGADAFHTAFALETLTIHPDAPLVV